MTKRRLEFLDLPSPKKRARLEAPEIQEGFSWSRNFGYVRFAQDGTQYKEIPLMLPFALSEVREDEVNPLPFHNWDNMYLHFCSDVLSHASFQAVSETLQAITFEDRAMARFAGYICHSRTIPFNYHTLPRSQKWIPPIPFNKVESMVSKLNPALFIDYPWIRGAYFPNRYFGIRQSFIINPNFNPWYKVHRGTKVILANVFGAGVTYFVTRVRFLCQDRAGVEVVAITDKGSFHDDTSLAWPPIMIEIPITMLNKSSFGDWVPSINETE